MEKVQPIRDHEKIVKIKKFLMQKNYRDYFLFVLGINTGLRIGDILRLKVKDVKDKEYLVLREQKTGKSKRIPLNSELQIEIANYVRYLDDEDYLFPSCGRNRGRPVSRIRVYQILREAAEYVGLSEIGTHTLRKTFGYHFYQKYKDVAILQRIFNHSAPSVTLEYIGISEDMIERALENFNL